MEYFDFDQASSTFQSIEDDIASDCPEIDESDAIENSCSVTDGKDFSLPAPHRRNSSLLLPEQGIEKPDEGEKDNGVYPMHRAEEPCDLCRGMGLDCFIAQRGVMMQNGCTCCISLYRECSFTHTKQPGKFFKTLHVVSEDVDVPTGGLTGTKALKSFGGTEDHDGRPKKTGARFPRAAVRVMKTWLMDHNDHPYPTDKEKDELKTRTGLKRSQISNWLANARRRGKVPSAPQSSSEPVTRGVNIPGKKLPPGVELSELNPFERWRHSPPENEPATERDIIRAMANNAFDPTKNLAQQTPVHGYQRKAGSSNDDSSFSNRKYPPSMSSAETSRSSLTDMSFASAFSHRSSLGSYGSEKKERRRRRQKPVIPKSSLLQKPRGARIFQCTFCTDSFPAKYDWQRHEKSLHIALDKWTCALQGAVLSLCGELYCTFCRAKNPDNEHMESHNFSACQEKTIQERTFYRKDHLTQHLRLMHNAKFDPWMEHWKSGTADIKSRCGFCGSTFTTWKDRVDHIAMHFKNGADMSQWKGDWGFEPSVQRLVENAIPPYLIHQDRISPNPFRASDKGRFRLSLPTENEESSKFPKLSTPTDASCFHRVQAFLSAYITHQVEAGVVPTDQMLQSEARQVIYGSDDPWNQTCADNPTWLEVLKRDNGLCDIPNAEHITLNDLGLIPPFASDGGLRQAPFVSGTAAQLIHTPESQSTGFQSPAFHSSGFCSGAPSVSGSYVGSFADSFAGSFAASQGLSSASGEQLSMSAPVSMQPPQTVSSDLDFGQLDLDLNDLGHEDMTGIELNGCSIDISNMEISGDALQGDQTSSIHTSASLPMSSPVKFPMDPPSLIPGSSAPVSVPTSKPFDAGLGSPFYPSDGYNDQRNYFQ
jgi:hypothetical protein